MSQGNSLPSPVRDAAFLSWVPGFHMQFPVWHLIFTPFCSTADYLTLLSLKQAELFCAYLFILLFVLLAMRRALIGIGLFMVYVAWAILVPRPMGRLMAQDPDILLIDFHSHTQYSHDGRPSFTPALALIAGLPRAEEQNPRNQQLPHSVRNSHRPRR